MAITGSGTSADPYKPTTWSEFLQCTTTDGKYTELPEGGGVFDMRDYYADGEIHNIPLRGFINGNGWVIKNAKVTNTSGTYSYYGFIISGNENSGRVEHLDFIDFTVDSNGVAAHMSGNASQRASAALLASAQTTGSGIFIRYCRFFGSFEAAQRYSVGQEYNVIIDVTYMSGYIDVCSFNLTFNGDGSITQGTNWQAGIRYCNIRAIYENNDYELYGAFCYCYIEGSVSGIAGFSYYTTFQKTVINADISGGFRMDYGQPSNIVVNSDKYSGTLLTGMTGLTTEQLKSKTDLDAVGFTISTDPTATTAWHLDESRNNGFPFIPIMLAIPESPPPMIIQPTRPLIHAYGSRETDFNGNGYAIIEPISCEIHQEENGVYEATFETYCDKYGKYAYLRKQAQVKIPMQYHGEQINQIFRIRQYARKMDSAGNYRITAVAQHKFYDLARRLIQDCRPTQLTGNQALAWLFEHGWYGGNTDNEFTYSSDITTVRTAYFQNCSVVAALLGVDQAFVNRWGGKLYRDNTRFSINHEMEGCQKSGIIQYGYNMAEIDFEEDDSDLITVLEAEDNFGNTYTITNPDVPTEDIPYHIYGYAKFTYETEDLATFHADAQAYFDEHKQSKINITVRFANLSDLEKYKHFLQLDDFEVGDKITIYHKDLDIYYSNLEIISKTYDVVAKKTSEIQIGSFKDAITRRAYMTDTVSTGSSVSDKSSAALSQDIYAANTNTMAASISGMETFTIAELEKRTISELEGD